MDRGGEGPLPEYVGRYRRPNPFLVAGLHLTFWGLAQPRTAAALVEGKLLSVSYNRFARPSSENLTVSEARIRADLTAIAKLGKAVSVILLRRGGRSGSYPHWRAVCSIKR